VEISRYHDKFLVEKWKTQVVCIEDWTVAIKSNQWNPLDTTKCLRSGTNLYQPTETRYNSVQVLIFPTLSARRSPIHAQEYVHELSAVVPQTQLMLEMRHFSRDGGEH